MGALQERSLANFAAQSPEAVPGCLKEKAIAHYNHQSPGPLYKHLEDSRFKIKKAFGVMVYLEVVLAKTNCSKGDEEEGGVKYSSAYLENQGCQPLPESEQEKQSCRFDIFIDTRSGKQAVIGNHCTILPGSEKPTHALKGH
ncbi:uncharacterized protein PHA67_000871 [Liasis olivaceus]